MAKKTAPAAAEAVEPAAGHYEGKVHYPKCLYSRGADGAIVSQVVADGAAELELVKAGPGAWVESPAEVE